MASNGIASVNKVFIETAMLLATTKPNWFEFSDFNLKKPDFIIRVLIEY